MKIIREILTIAAFLLCGIALWAQTPDCSVLDTMPHPRLLLSSQEMDALREQTVHPRSEAFARLHAAQIGKAREYVSEGLSTAQSEEQLVTWLHDKTEWASQGENLTHWRKAHVGPWQLDMKEYIYKYSR